MIPVERLTVKAAEAVRDASLAASRAGNPAVEDVHLLAALLAQEGGVVVPVLQKVGVDLLELEARLRDALGRLPTQTGGSPTASRELDRILDHAEGVSRDMSDAYVSTEHLLLGLASKPASTTRPLLAELGASEDTIRAAVEEVRGPHRVTDQEPEGKYRALERYSVDLTAQARAGKLDPVIGRDTEIRRVMQVLSRRTKNNPVLIGEPGVGKTAIAEGLAQRIVAGDVPESLRDKQLVQLDIAAMLAGAKYRGEFEERLKATLKEITESGGRYVVFLDELHTLVGAGAAEGAVDAGNMLKPALARGQLRLVGATTLDEYRMHIEKDPALERRFQPVMVREPSVEETVAILRGLKERYEVHHGVRITDPALIAAARLSERYIGDRFLPDKAIDLIDEAGSRMRIHRKSDIPEIIEIDGKLAGVRQNKNEAVSGENYERAANLRDEERSLLLERAEREAATDENGWVIDEEEIAEVLAQWTGIPVHRLTEEETARLVHMEDELHKRIIGQHDAIQAVSKAIRRTRAGLKDPRRPSGSFIFLGPSGVGKTETAKALTEFLFGQEDALIQLDMSEYMEKHTVSRLVGSPPGYVGYDEGGQLTEAVRRKPFSVVLFDEIEKAHPDVFNTLLQILEEGRLTDAQGRTVDFKNTVIIMTSNLGTRDLHKKSVGFHMEDREMTYDHMKARVTEELKKHFRPEFINRLDEIIVFHELEMDELKQIVDLMLLRVRDQLANQHLDLALTDDAKEYLGRQGYDPELGARPLRRAIQRLLEDPLSERVLLGEFKAGTTILVGLDSENEELSFEGVTSPDTPPVELAGQE